MPQATSAAPSARTDPKNSSNRRLASPWTKMLGLKLLPLPFRAASLKAHVVWHRSRRHDAGHRWVREGIVRLAAKLA